MTLEPMGDAAWRIALPSGADPASVLAALRALPLVLDAVVTPEHALVRFDPLHPPADPRPVIAQAAQHPKASPRRHVVRAVYDGPDLASVAALAGLTVDEVIARHAGRVYTVELIGFLPGFAYLGPVDPQLVIPRRPSPRPRVPPLAIGLAAGRTGIYPVASPGGWHLLGRAVGVTPFDPKTGALFGLGDEVVFEEIGSRRG